VELGFVEDRLRRWLIQSPSGTDWRVAFVGGLNATLTPWVDEVRGGIAFGERRFSECIMVIMGENTGREGEARKVIPKIGRLW